MLNNVTLVGNLTDSVDLRHTGSNTSVCNFTLAVNRIFKSSNGEREVDYIQCVAWRKTADILAQYTEKGSKIGLIGRLQTRNYTNNDGQKVYVTEVVAENIELLSNKSNHQSNNNGGQGNYTSKVKTRANETFKAKESVPNNWSPDGGNIDDSIPKGDSDSIDISDDDLPF